MRLDARTARTFLQQQHTLLCKLAKIVRARLYDSKARRRTSSSFQLHTSNTSLCLQADKERFARLDADKTGRSAKTVYRDKEKGTRLEGGAEELKALQDAKKPKHEKPAWGGGIAQVPTLPTMPQRIFPRLSHCRMCSPACAHVFNLSRVFFFFRWLPGSNAFP